MSRVICTERGELATPTTFIHSLTIFSSLPLSNLVKVRYHSRMRLVLGLLLCVIAVSSQNSALFRRFEYKHSFRAPNLAQRDGSIPFWTVITFYEDNIFESRLLGVWRCNRIGRAASIGSFYEVRAIPNPVYEWYLFLLFIDVL